MKWNLFSYFISEPGEGCKLNVNFDLRKKFALKKEDFIQA